MSTGRDSSKLCLCLRVHGQWHIHSGSNRNVLFSFHKLLLVIVVELEVLSVFLVQAAVSNPTAIAEMSQRVAEWEDNQRERKKKGKEKRGGKGRSRGGREEEGARRGVAWQLHFMTHQEVV